jgi:hypothetical protein
MRAGDDGLDVLWDIARAEPSNAAYLADRRAAVERFRVENRHALESWLGDAPGTWPRLYEREAKAQALRSALVSMVAILGLAGILRARSARVPDAAASILWLASAVLILWVVHHLVLGDFDFTVINLREQFLPRAALVTFSASLLAIGAHALVVRRPERLAGDHLTLVGLLLVANVGHVFAYGWPLGFPLPSQAARYFPFLGAVALASYALVAAVLIVRSWRRAAL